MRALYSLISRLRTLHALSQGMVTLAVHGWPAVTQVQLLILACDLGVVLRIVIPSPSAARGKTRARIDRLLSIAAAASIIGLAASEIVESCVYVGRIALGS